MIKELLWEGEVRNGSSGHDVTRVQEWLTLRGYATAIDGKAGDDTDLMTRKYQTDQGLPVTGVVDLVTFESLSLPMRKAFSDPGLPSSASLGTFVSAVALQHLAAKPREIGGENMGPWVRAYMKGKEGAPWHWCSGSACTMLAQACEFKGIPLPFAYHDGCSALAAAADEAGYLVYGDELDDEYDMPGGFFLVKTKKDEKYSHTGLFTRLRGGKFRTVEGNVTLHRIQGMYDLVRPVSTCDFIIFDHKE